MLVTPLALEQARSAKKQTKGARLARAFAGVTAATLGLSLIAAQATATGPSVDPSTYVHSICTAQSSYKSQVASIQASSNLSSANTPTEVRDRLVVYLNQIGAASNAAVTSFQSAGVPKIKSGNKIAALIVKEVTALRDAFARAARAAQALNVNNVTAFKNGTRAIAKLINAAGMAKSVLTGANKRYNITPLKTAASHDPSCQGLGI